MIIGLIPLLVLADTAEEVAFIVIYIAGAIFMFSSSSLYHALKQEENESSFWRRLDHTAIFFMIAGTYTAVCPLYLDGPAVTVIISIQWALVFAGIFFRFFWLGAPRILYTVIYLSMGWVAVFVIRDLFLNMPASAFFYLFAGGVAYTVGAVFYMLKKPETVFGFHEIFHLFILIGAFFHYLVVFKGLGM